MCHNSSACHVRNVGRVRPQPFLYVPAVSNVVTNGNGMDTKNVLKGTVRFGLSLVTRLLSLQRYYYSESKTILYLHTVYRKFLLYVSVEINPLKHWCFGCLIADVYSQPRVNFYACIE